MARYRFYFGFITVFALTLMFMGQLPAESNSSRDRRVKPPFVSESYRSPSSGHKIIVYAHEPELQNRILSEGGSLIADYGGFSLLVAPASAADDVTQLSSGSGVRDYMNLILLRAGAFDTTEGEPGALSSLSEPEPAGDQLFLVQMIGPIKQEWYDQLQANAEIVSYVPNNAYLVRAGAGGIQRLKDLKVEDKNIIQWSGLFRPSYKIAPELSLESSQETLVTVQLATTDSTPSDIESIEGISSGPLLSEPTSVLKYTNVRIKADPRRLADIARMSNVIWIEPWSAPQMLDERQDLIVAGSFVGVNGLAAPGYLNFLHSKHLDSTPDFIVDVSDSGIDQGILDPAVIHKDFLNQAGLARVVYARLLGQNVIEGFTNDTSGHGTLNAGIVGGYNTIRSFPYLDSEGYSLGLGVHPFVKLGISKIFNPEYTSPNMLDMVDRMYRDGARISSNSWGAYNNSYTTDAQLYDSLVRDARRTEPGNQELTVVFASGNKGAGGNLSTPATAKNVITVGASENLRPTGIDGCGIASDGADDILSLIKFSSSGPANDGRKKPDLVAPGTHIQSAQSQDRSFTAGGVCGPRNFPTGQSFYTWSSGTSHSTPAVAGSAALVRQFFQNSTGRPPSPAMVKAFLTNSTSYVSGFMGNDSLPGDNQGWGLVNVGRALDDTPRNMIDQTTTFGTTGDVTTIQGRVADPTRPFRVTIAWSDAPGTPSANPVVNDLDLQVEINGKTYLGNRFLNSSSIEGGAPDRLNNVESVWLNAGVTGDFTVRVVAANIAGDGVPGNGDTTDQDFALVIYNSRARSSGAGPVDAPPTVNVTFPVGGERLMAGSVLSVTWDASDDKGIQSQGVEFSSDGGASYDLIGTLSGSPRQFDWKIPSVPTTHARIRVSALDGVNLPSSAATPLDFEVIVGPPDTSPPTVSGISPNSDSVIGGGTTATIKWKEGDNVGVVRRLIELSTDGGRTFQPIATITAPGSGDQKTYDWQVPVALSTDAGKIRVTVFDGANNSSSVVSNGKFDIWQLPIITDANFLIRESGKGELEIFGRNFRAGETEIFVDGKKMKKVRFNEKCDEVDGTCKKISSQDKKVGKFVPEGATVTLEVSIPVTGQVSPAFDWKRKKTKVQ
ncbi:MAG TPA: S8 family serine peptidase [Blastocatellia bacterium]|nr:S8 family serine peptidase [Blastocatellia bacterium]